MDKTDLLELIYLSSAQPGVKQAYQQKVRRDPFFQNHAPTLLHNCTENSGIIYRAAAPFGRKSWSATRAFNDAMLARRFDKSLGTVNKCSVIKEKIPKKENEGSRWSPYKEYETDQIKRYGSLRGRALANGSMSSEHPGWTIGQRPLIEERKQKIKEGRKFLRENNL